MKLEYIVNKNKEFNDFKDEMNEKIKNEKIKLNDLNSKLDIDEFMKLDYDKAKEIYNLLDPNISYKEERDNLKKALDEIKVREHPILLKAHYYPCINEIDYLSDNQKNKLDKALYRFYNNQIALWSNLWRDINLSERTTKKVLDFLYGKGILSIKYEVYCNCRNGGDNRLITEEMYNDHKRYFKIDNRIHEGEEVSEEESDWYYDFEEDKRIWYVSCSYCEGREINSMSDIDDNSSKIYTNVTAPDMTYADK